MSKSNYDKVRAKIEEVRCCKLDELNLEGIEIDYLPAEVCKLVHLKRLNVAYSGIVTFPTEILQLPALVEVDFAYNRLPHIPREIIKLPSLQALFLYGNPIQNLPPHLLGSHPFENVVDGVRQYFGNLSKPCSISRFFFGNKKH